jgi:hypothetical protein
VEKGALDARTSRLLAVDRELVRYQTLTATELRTVLTTLQVPASDCYDKAQLLERLRSFLLSTPDLAGVGIPEFLEEQRVPFSVAPAQYQVMAGLLGLVNLGGAVALGGVLRDFSVVAAGRALPGLLGLSQVLYGPLMLYAIAFNVIPLARWFWTKEANAEVEKRNEGRRAWAKVLGRAVGPLYEKILAARNFKADVKVIKQRDIEYSTRQSAAEQIKRAEEKEIEKFDSRLRE